jgi:hypothetical protein
MLVSKSLRKLKTMRALKGLFISSENSSPKISKLFPLRTNNFTSQELFYNP